MSRSRRGRHGSEPLGWFQAVLRLPDTLWPRTNERPSLGDRFAPLLIAFVGPLALAVFLLPLGSSIGQSWSAAHGGGERGNLRVTEHDCGGGRFRSCQAIGVYTSDDGARTAPGVRLAKAGSVFPDVGQTVAVTWQGAGSPQVVYPEDDKTSWVFHLAFLATGTIAALWCLLCILSLTRRVWKPHSRTWFAARRSRRER